MWERDGWEKVCLWNFHASLSAFSVEGERKNENFKDKRLLNMKNTSRFHSLLIWVFLFFINSFIDFFLVCHQGEAKKIGGKRRVKNPEMFHPTKNRFSSRMEWKIASLTPRRLVNLWSHAEIFMEKFFFFFFLSLEKISRNARGWWDNGEWENNKVLRYFYFLFSFTQKRAKKFIFGRKQQISPWPTRKWKVNTRKSLHVATFLSEGERKEQQNEKSFPFGRKVIIFHFFLPSNTTFVISLCGWKILRVETGRREIFIFIKDSRQGGRRGGELRLSLWLEGAKKGK